MSDADTPEAFYEQLKREAEGREPAGPRGAPYAGVPRKRTEYELLTYREFHALMLRRDGRTLEQCAAAIGEGSRERVRQILLGAERRWERYNRRGW